MSKELSIAMSDRFRRRAKLALLSRDSHHIIDIVMGRHALIDTYWNPGVKSEKVPELPDTLSS